MAKTIGERYSHATRVHDARIERAKNARSQARDKANARYAGRVACADKKRVSELVLAECMYSKREANAYARVLKSIERIERDELFAMQLSIAFI